LINLAPAHLLFKCGTLWGVLLSEADRSFRYRALNIRLSHHHHGCRSTIRGNITTPAFNVQNILTRLYLKLS
jgi:hypothetical protein